MHPSFLPSYFSFLYSYPESCGYVIPSFSSQFTATFLNSHSCHFSRLPSMPFPHFSPMVLPALPPPPATHPPCSLPAHPAVAAEGVDDALSDGRGVVYEAADEGRQVALRADEAALRRRLSDHRAGDRARVQLSGFARERWGRREGRRGRRGAHERQHCCGREKFNGLSYRTGALCSRLVLMLLYTSLSQP